MQLFPGLLELKPQLPLFISIQTPAQVFQMSFQGITIFLFLSLIFGIKLHLHKHHQSHKLGL